AIEHRGNDTRCLGHTLIIEALLHIGKGAGDSLGQAGSLLLLQRTRPCAERHGNDHVSTQSGYNVSGYWVDNTAVGVVPSSDLDGWIEARDRTAREHWQPHGASAEDHLATRLEVYCDRRKGDRGVLELAPLPCLPGMRSDAPPSKEGLERQGKPNRLLFESHEPPHDLVWGPAKRPEAPNHSPYT